MQSTFRRITRRLFTIPAIAILAAVSRAQAAAPPAATHLGDLYREADSASPRARAARALTQASQARVSGVKRPPDPQLQFGWMNYVLPGFAPSDPLSMLQLQLMQMIPIAGQLGLAGDVAAAQASAQAERATAVSWEVRGGIASAFYDTYRTDRSLAVARETLLLLDQTRRTAESMYRVGQGRQADVLRAQVEIARMVEDTIRMTTMRAGLAARLDGLLDRVVTTPVPPPVLPVFPDSLLPLDTLIAFADRSGPMLQAGASQVTAAEAQATLAHRSIWPDLTIGLQYGRTPVNDQHMGSIMIGATLPIFAGSRQLKMREEAEAMQQMAVADLSAMRADTRAKVAETYATLVRARDLAVLYRTTVLPQAEATVESALSAYRVGSVDFATLLEDRMTVNKYRQDLAALEAEEGTAWADLEMLTGRVLFDADRTE
jgi:outer membrane protein TolC